MKWTFVVNCFLVGCILSAPRAMADSASCIQPYTENPRYWQYKGEPVLLLGGSKTDHLFLAEELLAHLDEMAAAGVNYARNTMSQREGQELKPHLRLPDGKFDLDQWNPEYWRRFEQCLQGCQERGIILQIEVWDRFDYSREFWEGSPWRPVNNTNYTVKGCGLVNTYPEHAHRDKQPFFHSIPGMPRYTPELDLIRGYQEKFVEKMLSYSLQYDNVLYCMNNETSTPMPWGQYWIRFIRERAVKAEKTIYLTDMFDDGYTPHTSKKVQFSIAHPAIYQFIDLSQVNSRVFNEQHWKRLRWAMKELDAKPRPLNHTKIYSDGETNWGSGTPKDGVERFWRNLIGGSASVRFHRPWGGIGLNAIAKPCIQSARLVEAHVKFWDLQPRNDLLGDREEDEAYLAARSGEAYVLYFTDGGVVTLDLSGINKTFSLYWVDISMGAKKESGTIQGGTHVPVTAPGALGWTAILVAH